MRDASVTVIIPTTAEKKRSTQIQRCVRSIRHSSEHQVQIMAMVNGSRFDADVCQWLQGQPDVQVHFLEMPSAPNAVLEGRRRVTTDYFATLDDDDEYLPRAIDTRLAALVSSGADFVITNSLRYKGADEVIHDDMHAIQRQPFSTLFEKNWLNSGNALFRSAGVGVHYFEDWHPFAEWTWLAFKLAMDGKSLRTVADVTNRIHSTEGSLSASRQYSDSYLPLFDKMLRRSPPREISRLIRMKQAGAFHDASSRALASGKWKAAALAHLRSLCLPGGYRYLSFTRRFARLSFLEQGER